MRYVHRFLNRHVERIDMFGHDHFRKWNKTRLGDTICAQTEYLITGDDEYRRW